MTRALLVERPFEWWDQRAASEPDLPITAGRPGGWTDLIIEVATYAAVTAAQARVAAGETTALEECLGAGRTCAEVRAAAEGELRAWQADGEEEDARAAGLSGGGR